MSRVGTMWLAWGTVAAVAVLLAVPAIWGAAWYALGVVPESVGANATVPQRSFGGFDNITYWLMGRNRVASDP